MIRIPFVDLRAQYERIRDEIDVAVKEVIESTQFIGGEKIWNFENNFARYIGSRNAVGVSSGTSALHLALEALGVKAGDEVITACNTFIATSEAISHVGAKPIFVDVEQEILTIAPDLIERAITPRTKVIVPVHLYGQSADMEAIRSIASKHDLRIVADAAQAHGGKFAGKRENILGDVTCFSFYPGKNLGAYGDAGLVATDDKNLSEKIRMIANHGRSSKHIHELEGYNYRLDAIQAAVLDVKLKYLDAWTEERRSRAALYDTLFEGGSVRPVHEAKNRYHVYHLYVVRVRDRDGLREELAKKGIAAGIHYPVPLHMLKAYEYLGLGGGAFPIAEKAASEIISLPMYPELSDDMVNEVAHVVNEWASG